MATNESLEQTLAEAKAEVERIQREIAERNSMSPEERFAIDLHEETCHADHTEHCGWHYESGPDVWWRGSNHKRYLEKAKTILKITDEDTAMKVIKAVQGY